MSRFYGYPVINMTPAEKLAHLAFMPILEAEDQILKDDGSLSPEALYDATLRATGSQGLADAARSARLKAEIRRVTERAKSNDESV